MTRIARSIVAAASLAALAAGSQAAPISAKISLDFEALGNQALVKYQDSCKPDPANCDASGVAVGGAFQQQGLVFSKATAFHDEVRPNQATPFGTGFIWADEDVIQVDVLGNFALHFDRLRFRYGIGQGGFNVSVVSRAVNPESGQNVVVSSPQTIAGQSAFSWGTVAGDGSVVPFDEYVLDIASITEIQSIQFRAIDARTLFTLDNVVLEGDPVCTTDCGTVPEPASFGLAAVALLGAGIATRRRRPV